MNSYQEDLLIEASLRFEDRLSSYEIYRWLEQFEESDFDLALELLLKLNYFTTKDIYAQFETMLPEVLKRINNYFASIQKKIEQLRTGSVVDKSQARKLEKSLKVKNPICVTGIGEYGKSGVAMMYYFTHTPIYRSNSSYLTIIDNTNRLQAKGAHNMLEDQTIIKNKDVNLQLILIDDVIGSGQTLTKYLNEVLKPQMSKIGVNKLCVHVCSLIANRIGVKYVKKNVLGIDLYFYGNQVEPAFSSRSSIFGYGPKRERMRDFCLKYGQGLYNSGYPDRIDFPLGHRDSQMLAVFPHTTPNNTLPIIWSNKRSWMPLFPRSVHERIDGSKKTRREMHLWITIAKRLGLQKYLAVRRNIYDTKNTQVLCLIKLLAEGKSLKYIVSKLGIFELELYEIIDRAISRELLTGELKLTAYAEDLYKQIKQELRKRRRSKKVYINDLLYLPKQIRGVS